MVIGQLIHVKMYATIYIRITMFKVDERTFSQNYRVASRDTLYLSEFVV